MEFHNTWSYCGLTLQFLHLTDSFRHVQMYFLQMYFGSNNFSEYFNQVLESRRILTLLLIKKIKKLNRFFGDISIVPKTCFQHYYICYLTFQYNYVIANCLIAVNCFCLAAYILRLWTTWKAIWVISFFVKGYNITFKHWGEWLFMVHVHCSVNIYWIIVTRFYTNIVMQG